MSSHRLLEWFEVVWEPAMAVLGLLLSLFCCWGMPLWSAEAMRAPKLAGDRKYESILSLAWYPAFVAIAVFGSGVGLWVLQVNEDGLAPPDLQAALLIVVGVLSSAVTLTIGKTVVKVGRRRRRAYLSVSRCRLCGYMLRGLSSNTCPECGQRIEMNTPLHDDPR